MKQENSLFTLYHNTARKSSGHAENFYIEELDFQNVTMGFAACKILQFNWRAGSATVMNKQIVLLKTRYNRAENYTPSSDCEIPFFSRNSFNFSLNCIVTYPQRNYCLLPYYTIKQHETFTKN